MNERELARRQPAARNLAGCRTTAPPAMPKPPSSSISGGRLDSARRHLHVRAEQLIAGARRTCSASCSSVPNALTMRWPVNASALMCDSCSSASWLRRVVRAHALAEPDQRIDDQRRAGQADERQPRVVVEQQRRVADQRQRLAREVADRLRHRLLHLADVVVDARHQLAGRARARRTPPTGRGCGGRARCADPSRRAGRRRPSGTTRRTTPMPLSR